MPELKNLNISAIRNEFPYLSSGMIYLNHAAIGPHPSCVVDGINRHLASRNRGSIENFEEEIELSENCRQILAALMNAPKAEQIAFTPNTSAGLNYVLATLNWQAGDRILVNDLEFPSNVYPYKALERLGVIVDVVPSRNGEIHPSDYEAHLHDDTRLIAISGVQFLSGFKADLSAFGAFARKHNLIFAVDAIQHIGASNFDVQSCGADIVAGGCHKWLMGPLGLGYLYVSEKILDFEPVQLGWLSLEDPWDLGNYERAPLPHAGRFEFGVPPVASIYGLHAYLNWINGIGWKKVFTRIRANVERVLSHAHNRNWQILGSSDLTFRAGIVSVRPGLAADLPVILQQLKKQNVHLSERQGWLRFSPHFYNTSEEINQAFERIDQII